GLVVPNEDDRLAVRRPILLRALGDKHRLGAVALHQPDFREAAAERGVQDLPATGREARVGVGVAALRELPGSLAAGAHAPDLHRAAAVADEDDGPLEAGRVELAGPRRRGGHGRGLLALPLRLGSGSGTRAISDDGWLAGGGALAGPAETVAI